MNIEKLFLDAITEWVTVKGKRLRTGYFTDRHRDPQAGCALTALSTFGKPVPASIYSEDVLLGVYEQLGEHSDKLSQNAFYQGFDARTDVNSIGVNAFASPVHIDSFLMGTRIRDWSQAQGYL